MLAQQGVLKRAFLASRHDLSTSDGADVHLVPKILTCTNHDAHDGASTRIVVDQFRRRQPMTSREDSKLRAALLLASTLPAIYSNVPSLLASSGASS
jgi:hypothetical protein